MEKRYYSRCLYGNYKRGDFKPLERFSTQSGPSYHPRRKNVLAGAILTIILIIGLCMTGCKTHQPTVIEKEKIVYQTKDSIVYKDSTVYVPYEVVKDYSLDTLVMKTSLAISKSWVDTSTFYIVGEMRNLKALQVKYVEVDKWHTKDSIVEKEKPVPYPVEVVKTKIPTVFWITFFICIGLLCYVGWEIYKKLRI